VGKFINHWNFSDPFATGFQIGAESLVVAAAIIKSPQ
jgi:hypothetical protein